MSTAAQVLVLAKAPVPGRVKTRLSPALPPAVAADLAHAALLDTVDAATASGATRAVVVLDGDAGPWLPAGLPVLPQRGGGLGDRLDGAFRDSWDDLALPMLLVGMDTPQLTPDLLDSALAALLAEGTDAVLGLADDGGWWALGLRAPAAGLFDGVPMSTPTTGAAQVARLAALGLRTAPLPRLRDVDLVDDVREVAALQDPPRRFAALAGTLGLVAA